MSKSPTASQRREYKTTSSRLVKSSNRGASTWCRSRTTRHNCSNWMITFSSRGSRRQLLLKQIRAMNFRWLHLQLTVRCRSVLIKLYMKRSKKVRAHWTFNQQQGRDSIVRSRVALSRKSQYLASKLWKSANLFTHHKTRRLMVTETSNPLVILQIRLASYLLWRMEASSPDSLCNNRTSAPLVLSASRASARMTCWTRLRKL